MDQRLGTAQWADPEFVEENFAYDEGAVWLGRSASDNDEPLGYSDDRHVCLVCGTRGGKGTSSIINNLCLWPGSVVVVDPKGENATVTAARRGQGSEDCEGMGQNVYVLDPFEVADVDPSYRARFNPLDAIDPDDREAIDTAALLADAIVVVREDSNDPFWEESGRQMVKALLLHVATDPQYEDRRNLVTVRKLIARGDWEAVEALRSIGEENIASAHSLLWEAVAKNPAFGGRLAEMGDSFGNMFANSVEQYESVLQVVKRNTEFVESIPMEECLAASDFSLSELKTDPDGVSLYLSLPQRFMSTHFRWMRMIVGLLIMEMEAVREQPACGHRILVMLDEFAGLERMKTIENAVSQMAGYGLKMFFVLQSLEQLKAIYKNNWETFLTNSGLKIFSAIDDNFTREYVSKQMGDTEVMREVRSAGENASESASLSESASETTSESTARSRSESTGTSRSHGRSVSESTSRTVGHSVTHGENRSDSSTFGKSGSTTTGTSWSPQGFSNSGSRTSGSSWSNTHSQGESDSWSVSDSQGTTRGSSQSVTEGASRTEGTSTSETVGRTRGMTRGTTRGTTRGETSGIAETVHRRPLCAPSEIGQLFARIDDRDDRAYPGLGLALISGMAPVVFRRVNYFEDIEFIGYFEPHPDHEMLQTRRCKIGSHGLRAFDHYFQKPLSWTCEVAEGEIVMAGDVVGYAEADELVPILAPRDGRVVAVPYTRSLLTAKTAMEKALAESPVTSQIGDIEILYYLSNTASVDPFADLADYCREIEDERERQARDAALKKARADKRRREQEQAEKDERRLRILDRRRWLFKVAGIVSLAGVIDGSLFIFNHAPVEALIGLGTAGLLALCGQEIRKTFIKERDNEHPPQKPQRQLPSAPPALTAGDTAAAGNEPAEGLSPSPDFQMMTANVLAYLESMKAAKAPGAMSPQSAPAALPAVTKAADTPPMSKPQLLTTEETISFSETMKSEQPPPGISPEDWAFLKDAWSTHNQ